ncbi:MAG: hypothetical protein FGM42_00080 [Ilumatobacteraceae bacterium]|nr:hypothetical protein [Ilumatobacteraceae bacterium]
MDTNQSCIPFHEMISAQLDGELSGDEADSLVLHLDSCASCRVLERALVSQHRSFRIRAADDIPDLATKVVAVAHPPRLGKRGLARQALAIIGLTELVFALPALVLGEDGAIPVHIARHVGSLGAALGLALLYVAWRPTRAYGLLPFVASLAAFVTIGSIVDISVGRATALNESTHLVELAGTYCVWSLAGFPRPEFRRMFSLRRLVG